MTKIKINDTEYEVNILESGGSLYAISQVPDDEKLSMDIGSGVDVLVQPSDYLILRDGDCFTTGTSEIEDNPATIVSCKLNTDNIALEQPKIKILELKQKDTTLDESWLYTDLSSGSGQDQLLKDELRLIVRNGDSFITIPISEGAIDIEECAKHDRKPPKNQGKYKIRIDGEKYTVEKPNLLGKEIIELTGKEWQRYDLQQKFKGGKREPIEHDQEVDFSKAGVERFETIPREAQQG